MVLVLSGSEENLTDKVISLFHEQKPGDESSYSYGEVLLVLGYAFQQYHKARKEKKISLDLKEFVSEDNLKDLHERHLPNCDSFEDAHVSEEEVYNHCDNLYQSLRDMLNSSPKTVIQKYHAVDDAMDMIGREFANRCRASQKNPYMVLLTRRDKFIGH